MQAFSISPVEFTRNLWTHRRLVVDLTKREALGRYKNSVLGVLWSFITPVFLLIIYTFVFSEVFGARWPHRIDTGAHAGSRLEFATLLFAGLVVFNLFAEVVLKAPSLVVSNANYVKKIIFPLELLPVVTLLSSLFHFSVGILMLLTVQLLVTGVLPWGFWLLPVVIVPLLLFTLGLGWFLSALGVYVRDVGQTIGVLVTGLMFVSPIFFPASAFPENWRFLMEWNPLAQPMEAARDVLIFGRWPAWPELLTNTVVSVAFAWLGFTWFQTTRRGFADVL